MHHDSPRTSPLDARITVHGTVVHGQKIGKKFDLPPTMNIEVEGALGELKQGIYAVKVRRVENIADEVAGAIEEERDIWLPGVAHFGPRPAVQASDSFEVHLFDFNEDWYGACVEIQMFNFIRPIRNFATIDELRAQILDDIGVARLLLHK